MGHAPFQWSKATLLGSHSIFPKICDAGVHGSSLQGPKGVRLAVP